MMNTEASESAQERLPVEQLTYEQAFSELETIVTALESEERALDESLALYERGQHLAQHCAGMLDQAEMKVQQLSGDSQSGTPLVEYNPG
jgi:exodeoxyribonuclease VII small subunit